MEVVSDGSCRELHLPGIEALRLPLGGYPFWVSLVVGCCTGWRGCSLALQDHQPNKGLDTASTQHGAWLSVNPTCMFICACCPTTGIMSHHAQAPQPSAQVPLRLLPEAHPSPSRPIHGPAPPLNQTHPPQPQLPPCRPWLTLPAPPPRPHTPPPFTPPPGSLFLDERGELAGGGKFGLVVPIAGELIVGAAVLQPALAEGQQPALEGRHLTHSLGGGLQQEGSGACCGGVSQGPGQLRRCKGRPQRAAWGGRGGMQRNAAGPAQGHPGLRQWESNASSST